MATRASRTAGRRGTAPASRVNSRETNQAIREGAAKNDWEVSERGRIPASVVETHNNR